MEEIKDFKLLTPSEEELADAHKSYLDWQHNSPNVFSNWFPKVRDIDTDIVKIPMTRIVTVPDDLLDAFFMEHLKDDEPRIRRWIIDELMPAVWDISSPQVFIKNGCYSGKFSFAGNCLLQSFDENTLFSHVMNIQSESLMYDTCGNLEFVVREYIEPAPGTPEIYHGMPLRPELRMFYDFTAHRFIYGKFYWDWDYCHDRICDDPHDKEVYERSYSNVRDNYERLLDKHHRAISQALKKVNDLEGVWSVDFILDEAQVWLIDMATGPSSAYYDPIKIEAFNKDCNV